MVQYCFRQLTREGLWSSAPLIVDDGVEGEQVMRQGVIGGFTGGAPRCALAENGFFYGLDGSGAPLSRREARDLGLIQHGEIRPYGQLQNDDLVREVRYCGYRQFDLAIKACDARLSARPGVAELAVIEALRPSHGHYTPCVSKTLLFGPQSKWLSKSELAALVKLVRRGLVQVTRGYREGSGYIYEWFFVESPERVTCATSSMASRRPIHDVEICHAQPG